MYSFFQALRQRPDDPPLVVLLSNAVLACRRAQDAGFKALTMCERCVFFTPGHATCPAAAPPTKSAALGRQCDPAVTNVTSDFCAPRLQKHWAQVTHVLDHQL